MNGQGLTVAGTAAEAEVGDTGVEVGDAGVELGDVGAEVGDCSLA